MSDQIDSPHAYLQAVPTETSIEAASKAIGRSGSWRERFFKMIAFALYGMTVVEVEIRLAYETPCPICACTHRAPKTQNEINTRLKELRDWGWIEWTGVRTVNDRTARVNTLTQKGYEDALRRYT